MPLFEVAILKTPSKKEREEGAQEEIVMEPTCVIARDIQGAAIKAVVSDPDKVKDVPNDQMEVIVRPFK